MEPLNKICHSNCANWNYCQKKYPIIWSG